MYKIENGESLENHSLKILIATISYSDVFSSLNYSGRIVNSDGGPKESPVDLESGSLTYSRQEHKKA